jgi:hypothetical protein
MLATSIKHGDLCVDFDPAGWVQVTRQSNAGCIQLSQTEWVFLMKCAELRGWPMAPPAINGVVASPDFGMPLPCTS